MQTIYATVTVGLAHVKFDEIILRLSLESSLLCRP